MRTLSIFIDESGDFAELTKMPSYYLVSLVFHEQDRDISKEVYRLEKSIKDAGFDIEYLHTGPIIRREEIFEYYTLDERRQLLYKLLNFFVAVPITCESVAVNRKEAPDKISLAGRLSTLISRVLESNDVYFRSFDNIIVYYDNGQRELSAILNAVFSAHYLNVEFRKAEPQRYRLLQAADFVCTMELLRIKKGMKHLSLSEKRFFYKPQELKKTFLKAIEKKKLNNTLY